MEYFDELECSRNGLIFKFHRRRFRRDQQYHHGSDFVVTKWRECCVNVWMCGYSYWSIHSLAEWVKRTREEYRCTGIDVPTGVPSRSSHGSRSTRIHSRVAVVKLGFGVFWDILNGNSNPSSQPHPKKPSIFIRNE